MAILNIVGDFSGRDEICKYVKNHVEALAKVQSNTGGFNTVIDDHTSYVEISATAGIIAGVKLAVEAGIVDEQYMSIYEKGIEEVKNAVSKEGLVGGVSTGTPVMPNAEAYRNISFTPTLYGQGLAIIAL